MGERWWRTFRKTDANTSSTVDLTPHCRNDELAFELSPYGKPSALVGGVRAPVSFNVSHSGHHGLIALAERGRIGVDVEERVPRHDPDGPIRTVFSRAEREELAAASGARKVDLFFCAEDRGRVSFDSPTTLPCDGGWRT